MNFTFSVHSSNSRTSLGTYCLYSVCILFVRRSVGFIDILSVTLTLPTSSAISMTSAMIHSFISNGGCLSTPSPLDLIISIHQSKIKSSIILLINDLIKNLKSYSTSYSTVASSFISMSYRVAVTVPLGVKSFGFITLYSPAPFVITFLSPTLSPHLNLTI